MKRGIAIADTHTGHLVGLTPPSHHIREKKGGITKRNKWFRIQHSLWEAFDSILASLPKLDFVFSLGDLIDGKAPKSGGVELITTDTQEQCDMAIEIFEHIRKYCRKDVDIIGVYGTDYHVSTEGEDWENEIAKGAGFRKIGAHEWVDVNGCIFDLKHHIGRSEVPHGRYTASAREMLWSKLWSEEGLQPKSDYILRAHAHYFAHVGDATHTAMILPALQGLGSRFGARRCSGLVDWGLVYFEVDDKGRCEWRPIIKRITEQRTMALAI